MAVIGARPVLAKEMLVEERQTLQTKMVQVQSILYLVDSYIADELLMQIESERKAG